MWQELREYWLPLMLFVVTLFLAALLALMVLLAPYLPLTHPLVELFSHDTTVRRTSVTGAVGLAVTAFVFFRPNAAALTRKSSSKKPPHDTMAGA